MPNGYDQWLRTEVLPLESVLRVKLPETLPKLSQSSPRPPKALQDHPQTLPKLLQDLPELTQRPAVPPELPGGVPGTPFSGSRALIYDAGAQKQEPQRARILQMCVSRRRNDYFF